MISVLLYIFTWLAVLLLCIAIAIWLGKSIALVSSEASNPLIGRSLPTKAFGIFSTLMAAFLLVFLPMKGCSHYQTGIYRDSIPDDLELEEVVFQDGQSGIREGCGTAIFRLSDKTLSYVRSEGLAFLQSARSGRKGRFDQPPKQYQTWKVTPTGKGEYIFQGCSNQDESPKVLSEAMRAANKDGAYYTRGHEIDLVIIPSLGILVLSHNG
jgi:hypothetical protein